MQGLVSELATNSELAQAFRERVVALRMHEVEQVLQRGIERGDLRADLDLELALDVLGGPLFYRLLITGGPIDGQLAEGVVELILRGFAPETKPPGRRKEAR
jgi:hypothetical protein